MEALIFVTFAALLIAVYPVAFAYGIAFPLWFVLNRLGWLFYGVACALLWLSGNSQGLSKRFAKASRSCLSWGFSDAEKPKES